MGVLSVTNTLSNSISSNHICNIIFKVIHFSILSEKFYYQKIFVMLIKKKNHLIWKNFQMKIRQISFRILNLKIENVNIFCKYFFLISFYY